MRTAIVVLFVVGLIAPAGATAPNRVEFTSIDAVSRWINGYRVRPEPARLPAAVRALSQLGAFKDVESSGVYVGFVAGVLSANPAKADDLVGKMLPMVSADQWAVVRAIAYSGLPEWKELLRKYADRLSSRQVMIDKYLEGKLMTLDQIPLEQQQKSATVWDKVRAPFQRDAAPKQQQETTFDKSPELLDTLWGFYFGTGSYLPIGRMIMLLSWAGDRDSVDRLTVGSMAKYTLASNAARDGELLAMLKRARLHQAKKIASVLNDVIDAAETMETTRMRKDALAAIDELKRKGPGYKRDVTTWSQIGQGALALGCVAAAAAGQVEVGIPCVVGGAASSAALNFWNTQQ
jgi:hypothetical protein